MAKSEHYNQYPEGFLEKFTEPVVFKLIDIKDDPENEGAVLMSSITSIPPESKVSFTDESGETHLVRLALISNIDAEGNIKFNDRRLFIGQLNNGEIRLDPKRAKDIEVWRYLHHCHWNKSSPYAEEDGKHIVYEYDWEEEARQEISERSIILNAMKFAASASNEDIKSVYRTIVNDSTKTGIGAAAMRNKIEQIAMEDPKSLAFAIQGASRPNQEIEEDVEETHQTEEDMNESVSAPPSPRNVMPLGEAERIFYQAKEVKAFKQVNVRKEFRDLSDNVIYSWSKSDERTPSEQFISAIQKSTDLADKLQLAIDSIKGN